MKWRFKTKRLNVAAGILIKTYGKKHEVYYIGGKDSIQIAFISSSQSQPAFENWGNMLIFSLKNDFQNFIILEIINIDVF